MRWSIAAILVGLIGVLPLVRIPTHVRIHLSSMKEETSTHKSIKCVEVSSIRPPLREALPGLHACNTLVRIFLSIIANDGQLEVFALEAVDH